MDLEDYFTRSRIINQLCRKRIASAHSRNELCSLERFAVAPRQPEVDDFYSSLLPPRNQWGKYRPRFRKDGVSANLIALQRATVDLGSRTPQAPWAKNLDRFVEKVRTRVLSNAPFHLIPPEICWIRKKKDGDEFRPICRFAPEEGLIISLYAAFLRDSLDPAFSPDSFAFRAARNGVTPTHQQVFEQLYLVRCAAGRKTLFVAECDLRAFFDTVDHEAALVAYGQMAEQFSMPERSADLFRAYLDCYSFPVQVLSGAQPKLQRLHSKGYFKWPTHELSELHQCDARELRIGIPQGGAVSGVIANLVLNGADQRIAEERIKAKSPVHYFRFCDDMVLLTENRADCEQIFAAYLKELDRLKLSYHLPRRTTFYGAAHWSQKSKSVYCWNGLSWFGSVPWLQFVGFQIRYDCLVRPRKETVRKHKEKLIECYNEFRRSLRQMELTGGIAATKKQVAASFEAKLINMGIGRSPRHRVNSRAMSWAEGYAALRNKPLVTNSIRGFDRLRIRLVTQFRKLNLRYGRGVSNRSSNYHQLSRAYRNSYHAQFPESGGHNRIQQPWRRAWYESLFLRPIYLFCRQLFSRG